MKDIYYSGIIIDFEDKSSILVPNITLEYAPYFTTYQVQKDDTLFSIAIKFYRNTHYWVQIAEYNNLEDPVIIPENTILNIPLWTK